MIPVINMRETGINLRLLMDKKGISVKEVKDYLGLTSIQSVYNWLNGLNMPTIDNLYALCSIVKQMDTIFKYIYTERQNYSCLSI